MPIYEYRCRDCGSEFEVLVRADEKPVCSACGKRRLEKKPSVPAAHSAVSIAPACPAKEAGVCGERCGGGRCGMGQF